MYIRVFDLRAAKLKFAALLSAAAVVSYLLFNLLFDAYIGSRGYSAAALSLSEDKLIIIDAGHGGEDPGAVAVNGRYEKDLNLEIAFTLGGMLAESGYAVMYTRTTDRLLYSEDENIKGMKKIYDLKNRCKIAAEFPNALFISIHMNSYSNPKYSGLQVYYTKDDDDSRQLASDIQGSVNSSIEDSERVIKCGEGLYILENTPSTAVLIECGFLSNAEEAEKLSQKEYQKRLSSAIICGIIEYKENNRR